MYHGAPKLDELITRQAGLRPRNVTATDQEREHLLTHLPPHLRLWLLFCSDTAIRSGTAARLGPDNYDPARRELHFTTKMGERLTLPVTEAISAALAGCNMRDRTPFIKQLWVKHHPKGLQPHEASQTHPFGKQFATWRRKLGITRQLTPHDFRRTTAVAMLEATRDIRDVQALLGHRTLKSTIWYLDHDLRPVKRSTLELIKRPAWRKDQTA